MGTRLLEVEALRFPADSVSHTLLEDVAEALTRVPAAQREEFAQKIKQQISEWFQPLDNRTLLLEAAEELSQHPSMPDYIAVMEELRRGQARPVDDEK